MYDGLGGILSSFSPFGWSHAGIPQRNPPPQSNPPIPYECDRNDFYALKVFKVYLYEPYID